MRAVPSNPFKVSTCIHRQTNQHTCAQTHILSADALVSGILTGLPSGPLWPLAPLDPGGPGTLSCEERKITWTLTAMPTPVYRLIVIDRSAYITSKDTLKCKSVKVANVWQLLAALQFIAILVFIPYGFKIVLMLFLIKALSFGSSGVPAEISQCKYGCHLHKTSTWNSLWIWSII